VTYATEHTFAIPVEVEPGILRVTLPLPSGPMHVHSYLLRGDDGWTLVDTGLGLPDSPWDRIAAGLDAPVVRIFITHMHPDHVGGAAPAAEATGAPVVQGRLDYEQCERVWGHPDWPRIIADWFLHQGVPSDVAEELLHSGHVFADFVRFAWNPTLVEPGDEIDGWRVLAAPGHADGHLALLRERDCALIAGDAILTPITPAVGLWPDSRPDPLGDYLGTLRALGELSPRIAYTGHGNPVADVKERAAQIAAHHDERLAVTEAALSSEPRSGFEVSHAIFGRDLAPIQRRFAVAEALSHLEWLVRRERAHRHEDDRGVSYTRALV
jgi:glyoxylase-like metal-dependent hydrolase (beta-lactamase superfamily II)